MASFCLRFAASLVNKPALPYVLKCLKLHRQFSIIPTTLRTSRTCLKPKVYGLMAGILTFLGLRSKEEEEDTLITTMKRGILCHQRKEYDKAETILHLALKIAQEREDMLAQTYVFDLLANTAYEKGDLTKAENLFIQVIKELLSRGMSQDDNALVEISLKLAIIYSQKKEDAKAEEGFKFCINTQQKKIDLNRLKSLENTESLSKNEIDDYLLWAMSVEGHGKHLFSRHYYKAAEDRFQKALDVCEKLNGISHPQSLVLINALGNISYLLGAYDKAIGQFKMAIDNQMASETPEPAFYCNLGSTYIHKGEFKKAESACSKALHIAKKSDNTVAEIDAKECLEDIEKAKRIKL